MKNLTIILVTICFNSFGQKQANVWYFGNNGAGLDFNGCTPTVLTDGHINGFEGCSSISDKATGQFLFCTNSEWVWNRNQDTIPNSHLMGSNTITQVLIIQKPGFDSLYYIITSEVQGFYGPGYMFHCIDMTMNGGLGGMAFKDSLLYPPHVTEKITAVRHANGTDIWLIGHQYNSNNFLSFLMTSSGINTTPVISQIGKFNGNDIQYVDAIGELKASPDGSKLATVTLRHPNIELFDFDNSTGQLSNLIILPEIGGYDTLGNVSGLYGLSFSSNNSMLYASQWGAKIIQYNISSNDSLTINNSRIDIFTSTIDNVYSLKLAPNGKIYVGHHYSGPSSGYLGVINSPNSLGMSCNYVDNGIYLNGLHSGWGLNNLMEYGYYCNESVGINENERKPFEINIYPNPFTSQTTISFSEEQKNTTIKITDILGQEIKTINFSGKQLVVEKENKKAGIYFVQITDENKNLTNRKIIIQ